MFAATISLEYANGHPETKPPRARGDPSRLEEVEKSVRDYRKYLNALWYRFPSSYHRMNEFMKRGSCRCGPKTLKLGEFPCQCATSGQVCACRKPQKCTECPSNCETLKVEGVVRVYDIDTSAQDWDKFFVSDTFQVCEPAELHNLKIKLAPDLLPKNTPVPAADISDDKTENEILNNHPQQCRVITVSHLSPEVVQILGGVYGIAADFFNRHLPGTEAISGKLISRLPSTVQLDFDELYESTQTFPELFNEFATDGRTGHDKINKAIKRDFLFPVGWDYFPVSQRDWDASVNNSASSSGFEILMQDDLKNVFQFNLAHRISISSQPSRHPNTAIIIFYPKLHMQHWTKDDDNNPTSDGITFRSVPSVFPSPVELDAILDATKDWEKDKVKQNFASAFDDHFTAHVKQHYRRCHEDDNANTPLAHSAIDHTTFVHLYGSPLFKMIAANLARLIVRRSFDLDLLEWRPKQMIQSRTIDEIKSRRIAITRHQRNITGIKELLGALMLEESGQLKAKKFTTKDQVRTHALTAEEISDDTWASIYWDFSELEISINALASRADKIQEGLVGLIQVYGGEKSATLTLLIQCLTIVLVPFSVMGSIWGNGLNIDEVSRDVTRAPGYIWSVLGIGLGIIVALLCSSSAIEAANFVWHIVCVWWKRVWTWVSGKWSREDFLRVAARWKNQPGTV